MDESQRVRSGDLLEVFLPLYVTAMHDETGREARSIFYPEDRESSLLRSAEPRNDEEAENEKKGKEPVRSTATDTEHRERDCPQCLPRTTRGVRK